MSPKGAGDPYHHHQAWITSAALDATQVSQIDTCFEREFLLRQSLRTAKTPNIASNNCLPVHHDATLTAALL
jgi:hypothetical protein